MRPTCATSFPLGETVKLYPTRSRTVCPVDRSISTYSLIEGLPWQTAETTLFTTHAMERMLEQGSAGGKASCLGWKEVIRWPSRSRMNTVGVQCSASIHCS